MLSCILLTCKITCSSLEDLMSEALSKHKTQSCVMKLVEATTHIKTALLRIAAFRFRLSCAFGISPSLSIDSRHGTSCRVSPLSHPYAYQAVNVGLSVYEKMVLQISWTKAQANPNDSDRLRPPIRRRLRTPVSSNAQGLAINGRWL